MQTLKYFRGSFAIMALVYLGIFWYTGSVQDLMSAATLTIVEIAVSFDNAIVNASKLSTMNAFWRRMFLTLGMLIAVGFMRLYFPIQIVSIVGDIPLTTAFDLAFTDQNQFAQILVSSHTVVAGFGGAFLMMVFMEYFVNAEKEVHWIPGIEHFLTRMDEKVEAIQAVLVLVAAYTVSTFMDHGGQEFFNAALIGVGVFIMVDALKRALEAVDEALARGTYAFLAGGLGTFIYLEVLDASFSFDGVIAAFAISKSILIVGAGLGIGALFVRSMTIMLVEQGTLSEFCYLEHGAFWAIGGLSGFMFAGALIHIPEWVIAGTSAVLILASFAHSVYARKQMVKEAAVTNTSEYFPGITQISGTSNTMSSLARSEQTPDRRRRSDWATMAVAPDVSDNFVSNDDDRMAASYTPAAAFTFSEPVSHNTRHMTRHSCGESSIDHGSSNHYSDSSSCTSTPSSD